MNSFKNFVPQIFEPKAKKLERDRQRIANQEQQLEADRGVLLRAASLQDAFDAALSRWTTDCANIDAWLKAGQTVERYAEAYLRGESLSAIGNDMTAKAALEVRLEDFKGALRKLIVEPVEQSKTNFQKTHKTILAKYPDLKRTVEPPFVAAPPAREWSDFVPVQQSPEVARMLGLKQGETMPRPAWEKPDSGGIKIRDIDED